MLFAATYGVLEVVTGEPEASFVFFSLGLLLTTVGGLLRGSQLRRAGVGMAGGGLIAAAVLGFLAIAVGSDPFHDIFLLSGYAAWAVRRPGGFAAAPRTVRTDEYRRPSDRAHAGSLAQPYAVWHPYCVRSRPRESSS